MAGARCWRGNRGTPHSRGRAFGEIRNRAAEVAEHPLDVRIAFRHAAEDELRRGERRVHEESDERHEPVVEHRFDADRICRMNVQDRAESVRGFPERPETLDR